MFSVTHFQTEFITQSQAAILRKVTLTQFMLVISLTALGIGLFGAPLWLAPLLMAAGYLAGYRHNGEILLRRLLAYLVVRLRQLGGTPRVINLAAEWDAVRQEVGSRRLPGRRLLE